MAVDRRADYRACMRWRDLFDDLEGQLEHELGAEDSGLQAEEERLRIGRLALRERLIALTRDGACLRLWLPGGEQLAVSGVTVGRDWLSGEIVTEGGRKSSAIVPLDAICGVVLAAGEVDASLAGGDATASWNGEAPVPLAARLGLAFVLRDLARRRSFVELRLTGLALGGTIDRVGRDHLDLAMHEPGTPRRSREVSQFRLVPFAQLSYVRI